MSTSSPSDGVEAAADRRRLVRRLQAAEEDNSGVNTASSGSSCSSSDDEGGPAAEDHRRQRRAAAERRRLVRRLQAAEEDNSMDIALVVLLCTMVVLMLLSSVYVMQGESYFFASNQNNKRNHQNRRPHRARSRRRKVNPTVVDLSFTLNDLYAGTKRAFKVQRQVVCPSLRTGDAPSRAHCETAAGLCRGREVKMQAQRDFFTGKVDRTFFCRYMARIHARVPPGTRHGDTIEVEGAGSVRPGMHPGDVVVRVVELSNRIFEREGDDLRHSVSLSLREALLGWSREVAHLDGRIVTISSASRGPDQAAKTTSSGEVVIVKGEGMPKKDSSSGGGGWFSSSSSSEHGRGDLRVVVKVEFPRMKRLPREWREEVARLFD
jgi:DnaJ-class molecular chaperone